MDALAKIANKIWQCPDYQTLYSLESDFNEVGLTIQTTSNSRIILCKIKDHKPLATEAMVDYIYIGSLDKSAEAIADGTTLKIIMFTINAKGTKSEIKNLKRTWQDGLRMYEQSIAVEDKQASNKTITEGYQIIED